MIRRSDRRGVFQQPAKLLVSAFAETPREHYLGPPPWKLLTLKRHRSPRKSHPRHLYQDVLVGILPERLLNNGQPSGLAMWFDALNLERNERVVHIGCGTGYYTAILANVVGPGGHVRAFEIDAELAPRAASKASPRMGATRGSPVVTSVGLARQARSSARNSTIGVPVSQPDPPVTPD